MSGSPILVGHTAVGMLAIGAEHEQPYLARHLPAWLVEAHRTRGAEMKRTLAANKRQLKKARVPSYIEHIAPSKENDR